jgi:protein-S-isoprenylcysteine O-methyltransferase Ste14
VRPVPSALDAAAAKTVALLVLVGVVLIGTVLTLVIKRIVGRLIVAFVVIGLSIVLWYQRTNIQDRVDRCGSNPTFFGVTVQFSHGIEQRCARLEIH